MGIPFNLLSIAAQSSALRIISRTVLLSSRESYKASFAETIGAPLILDGVFEPEGGCIFFRCEARVEEPTGHTVLQILRVILEDS